MLVYFYQYGMSGVSRMYADSSGVVPRSKAAFRFGNRPNRSMTFRWPTVCPCTFVQNGSFGDSASSFSTNANPFCWYTNVSECMNGIRANIFSYRSIES